MKRIDIDPIDENLIDLMERDPLHRNNDLADIARILNSIEGGYTIFLDSDWGAGKTFFVKQLKLLLECANADLPSDEEVASLLDQKSKQSILNCFKELNAFVPVYYNAWENDYWDDPLPTIAASIAKAGGVSIKLRENTTIQEKLCCLADSLLELGTGRNGVVQTISSTFGGKKLTKGFDNRTTLRDSISELVTKVLPAQNERLLLIIDELDRCKPTFALEVLEELKTLFEDDRVIILYALNTSQLIHTVEGQYGIGTDGARYLSRFYDSKISLRKIPSETYLKMNGFPPSSNRFDSIAKDMSVAYEMTPRDMNRYISELENARILVNNTSNNDYIYGFAEFGIVPVLLAMKVSRSNEYKQVIDDLTALPLFEALNLSDSAINFLDAALGKFLKLKADEKLTPTELDSLRIDFLQNLIYLIWIPDIEDIRYRNAREKFSSDSWYIDDLPDLSKLF